MSDQQSGLNAPVQPSAPEGTQSQPKGKTTSGFGRSPAQAQATPKESNFYSYKHDDGEEIKFKSPDDLNRYIRDGTLRHKDYTKKTQEVAEARKAIEKEREQNRAEYQAGLQAYNQWKATDDWLKQNQRVVEIIRREGGPVPSAPKETAIPDEVKSELEELKNWRNQQEEEAALQRTLQAIKGQYEDFDEESVKELYKQLDEAPEGEEMRALYEILHFASKGKNGSMNVPLAPVTPGGRVPPSPKQAPFTKTDRNPFQTAKKAYKETLKR